MDREIRFEIKAQLGVIQEYPTGWRKELNLVAWNGNQAKFDVRDWDPEHEHMSRGITLTEKEMSKMMDIVAEKSPDIKDVFAKEKAKHRSDRENER